MNDDRISELDAIGFEWRLKPGRAATLKVEGNKSEGGIQEFEDNDTLNATGSSSVAAV